jgi:trans-aconitate 2-methyltransferase
VVRQLVGFEAPFVHVAPDAYVEAATASRFAVEHAEVDDRRWNFGSRAAFAAWCAVGMVAWTSRPANDQWQAFIDDVLSAHAEVSGSDSVFRVPAVHGRTHRGLMTTAN